jgi:hypothetical protein
MGRSKKHKWRELDVQGAEGQWSRLLDESAADGNWRETARLSRCG